MIAPFLLVLLFEVLMAAVAAIRRVVQAPSQRRSLWVVCVAWHVLPLWAVWRAAAGRVLRLGYAAAARACDAHERAQAAATYPAQDPGI